MRQNFEIAIASRAQGPIEVYSDIRLPFEPKGWLVELRTAIGRSVEGLRASSEEILYATYISSDDGKCDAENVLLYNVGPARFKEVSRNGLLFERSFEAAPLGPSGHARPHYQGYSIKPKQAGPEKWQIGQMLASWSSQLPTLKNPTSVWFAIQPAVVMIDGGRAGYEGAFGLDIELKVPGQNSLNVTSAMKPLLDGLISAFSSYSGSPPVEEVGRLARHLAVSEQEVGRALANETGAVLKPRRVVVTRGNGVQWNPADDLCHLCKLRVAYGAQELSVSGSAFIIHAPGQASL